MGIASFAKPGTVYTSKGMLFVVLSVTPSGLLGEVTARCLVLADHPQYTRPIPAGTIMDVESWTSVWEEAMQVTL